MKLTVVRHGETEENAAGIVQGHMPGTLSEEGVQQAKTAAKQIRGMSFDAIYCSDLKRCVDTAAYLLNSHSLPITYTQSLREISFGEYQGKHVDDLPDWDSLDGTFYTRRLPGGETKDEFIVRTKNFINQVLAKHQNEHILLITHAGNIRVIRSLVEGHDLWELYQSKPPNCSIWEFEVSNPLGF